MPHRGRRRSANRNPKRGRMGAQRLGPRQAVATAALSAAAPAKGGSMPPLKIPASFEIEVTVRGPHIDDRQGLFDATNGQGIVRLSALPR